MPPTTLVQELTEANYALNRAIGRAEDSGETEMVSKIETIRDQTWSLIAALSGKE